MIAALIAIIGTAAAGEAATCSFGPSPPEPCRLEFTVDRDGTTVLTATATAGAKRAIFSGKRQSGWWSGTLDGRPAMAYERNRGNVTFVTQDLSHNFEYATPGHEHGRY